MRRVSHPERDGWREKVERVGLVYHTTDDGQPYWCETAHYEFTARQIDVLEQATATLNDLTLRAVEQVLAQNRFDEFRIPREFVAWVRESWERDDPTLYGRFDLLYDGSGPPKLCEYNADTPTALLEAAVVQWHWLEETERGADQFNSLHEKLIARFAALKEQGVGPITFASVADHVEDYVTATYLRDVAVQAGLQTQHLRIEQIGWNARRAAFVDLRERPLGAVFKLYPWEWLTREAFGRHLTRADTRWIEPPWKMLLSNKALLPLLWELFPDHPNLLRASWQPLDVPHVRKPIFGREGANVSIVHGGQVLHATGGTYGDEPCVCQEFFPTPRFEGNTVVLGSWVVEGEPCGLGIREDAHLVTTDASRFVPHLFR